MRHFTCSHILSKPSEPAKLFLHDHESFELYWFLDGDVDYIVEGKVYPLKPYEIVLLPPHIMHRAVQKSPVRYERLFLHIDVSFFEEFQCVAYAESLYRINPKIDADLVFSSGLYQLLERLRNYSKDFSELTDPIMLSFALEAVYLLSQTADTAAHPPEINHIQRAITYINNHFSEKFSLDELADAVFLSKGHLCRSFKKATGYTVISYLNHIRINHAKELYQQGMSLSEAGAKSGFSSYAHFYKAFLKENGRSPREVL